MPKCYLAMWKKSGKKNLFPRAVAAGLWVQCPAILDLPCDIVFCRRDSLRFLAHLDDARFPPSCLALVEFQVVVVTGVVNLTLGLRQQLDELGIGQAFFLLAGLPPWTRLKDMRAKTRGELRLAWTHGLCCRAVVFAIVSSVLAQENQDQGGHAEV